MSGIKRLFERGPFTELLWSQALQTINALINGRANNTGSFTLTAGATSTTVTDIGFESQQVIAFYPTTSNAAAAMTTTYIQDADKKNGQFTVTHANNAQTDRTFSYIRQG